MQELMLGDLASSGDEPIPPQYQELVDRYHQVLATEGQSEGEASRRMPPRRGTSASEWTAMHQLRL